MCATLHIRRLTCGDGSATGVHDGAEDPGGEQRDDRQREQVGEDEEREEDGLSAVILVQVAAGRSALEVTLSVGEQHGHVDGQHDEPDGDYQQSRGAARPGCKK